MNIQRVLPFFFMFSLVALIISCSSKEKEENKQEAIEIKQAQVKSFNTVRIQPADIMESINITGRVVPIQKVDVTAQVQGVAKQTAKPFKEGVDFKKGETLVDIDNEEFKYNLTATKSQFVSSLVRIMSDLKIDFPNDFEKWNKYLESISIKESLPQFPEVNKPQLRYYLSTNNIYNLYYSIKSAEEVLKKYQIKAPFDGSIVESRMDEGSLVRPGSPLGSFIRTDQFEIRASVSISDIGALAIGQQLTFQSPDTGGKWTGSIVRIGKKVDASTQAVTIYLLVQGRGLKEGMYLEGTLASKSYNNAAELSRNAITRNNQVYVIADERVHLKDVNTLSYHDDKVVVSGLDAGDLVITDEINTPIQGITARAK